MLKGLSVHDGSMSASVKWRRVWWKFAGIGMFIVAAGFLALAWSSRPWGGGGHFGPFWFGLPVAALAAALEGVRLVRKNRKSATNVRLHRWSIRAWIAAAVCATPESGALLAVSEARRKAPNP